MRCLCCNANLNDYESTLRHPETLDFLDICVKCLKDIPITPIEPTGISPDVGFNEDEFEESFVEDSDD